MHTPGRQLYRRILLRGRYQRAAAGRYGNQDDSSWQKHPQHHRIERHISEERAEHLSGPGAGPERRGERPKLYPVRFHAHRRPLRGAHVPVHRREKHQFAGRARGLHLKDRRRSDFLLQPARNIHGRRRIHDCQRFLQGRYWPNYRWNSPSKRRNCLASVWKAAWDSAHGTPGGPEHIQGFNGGLNRRPFA